MGVFLTFIFTSNGSLGVLKNRILYYTLCGILPPRLSSIFSCQARKTVCEAFDYDCFLYIIICISYSVYL